VKHSMISFVKEHKKMMLFAVSGLLLGFLVGGIYRYSTKIFKHDSAGPIEVDSIGIVSILPETAVVWEDMFRRCGHTVSSEWENNSPYVGFSKNDLLQKDASLIITAFSAKRVHILKRHDLPCPEHLVLQMDGKTGDLQVLQTDPQTYEVIQKLKIMERMEAVSEDTKAELINGVLFSSHDEINRYLESIEG